MTRETLPKPADFERVRKARQAKVSDVAIVQGAPRPDGQPQRRLGVVVPRKAVGNSVQRNRVARVLREAFWTQLAEELPDGHDYVIVARNGLPAVDADGGMLAVAEQLKPLAGRLARDLNRRAGARQLAAARGTHPPLSAEEARASTQTAMRLAPVPPATLSLDGAGSWPR